MDRAGSAAGAMGTQVPSGLHRRPVLLGREDVPHDGSGFEICPFHYRSRASVGRVRKAVCKWPCIGDGTAITLTLLGWPPAERGSLGTSVGQSLGAPSSIKTPGDTQGPASLLTGPPSPESILSGQSATSLDQRRISPPGFGPLNTPPPPPSPPSPRRSLFCRWLSLASPSGRSLCRALKWILRG